MKSPGYKRVAAIAVISIVAAAVSISGCTRDPSSKKISAGVAANFIKPFGELAAEFEGKTGIKVETTFTSSGTLYNQIKNGAPYDIFLSADEERPTLLLKEGKVLTPFVYAKGEVILWSGKKELCTAANWREALTLPGVNKISIANPATAPYGLAAKSALVGAELWDSLQPKLVNGQDIAQAFQYASTGATDMGFCAFSAAFSDEGKKGGYYAVAEAPAIVQSACVVKSTEKRDAADKFATFLVSPEAEKIKKKYGYK